MRLVTYSSNGASGVGALASNGIIDLGRACAAYRAETAKPEPPEEIFRSMLSLLGAQEAGIEAARCLVAWAEEKAAAGGGDFLLAEGSGARLLAPVPRPGKLLGIGLNYRDHAEEQGAKIPEWPTVFAKASTSVIGPGTPVLLPAVSGSVDYEGELAFVIGRRVRSVAEDSAMEAVAGYTILNDVSARDYQMRTRQWMIGKSFDTFAPMGPALVTRDEVPDPHALGIRVELNGKVMQESNTSNLIFKIPFLVSYLSRVMTLEPGDVVTTGTPSGVGAFREPPVFLKPGDTVRIEIERLGVLENTTAAEPPDLTST